MGLWWPTSLVTSWCHFFVGWAYALLLNSQSPDTDFELFQHVFFYKAYRWKFSTKTCRSLISIRFLQRLAAAFLIGRASKPKSFSSLCYQQLISAGNGSTSVWSHLAVPAGGPLFSKEMLHGYRYWRRSTRKPLNTLCIAAVTHSFGLKWKTGIV